MDFRSEYEKKYGDDLNWDNLENFFGEVMIKHKSKLAEIYVKKTTLESGKFVGDKRVIELIKNNT